MRALMEDPHDCTVRDRFNVHVNSVIAFAYRRDLTIALIRTFLIAEARYPSSSQLGRGPFGRTNAEYRPNQRTCLLTWALPGAVALHHTSSEFSSTAKTRGHLAITLL